MTIIVDNGAYSLRNMGDVAMLQVAVSRIRRVHPGAEILVLTRRPDLLRRYCPATLPVSTESRDRIFSSHSKNADPYPPSDLTRTRADGTRPEEFARAFAAAEIIVVAGGGFINDGNLPAAQIVLRMARSALHAGKKVAFLSQGLGPVNEPGLLELLGDVCLGGGLFGLREPNLGPSTLRRAGAMPGSWEVTGDDALATTCDMTMPCGTSGKRIGFCLRKVSYSGVESRHLSELGNALNCLRERTGALVAPLPVSFNTFENDLAVIESVIGKQENGNALDDPHALATAAGRCRIVITAAYHAAVFALAQGVPCLCLYACSYYREKMAGLTGQFADGCCSIDLNQTSADEIVKTASALWQNSAAYRAGLRTRAADQVKISQAFAERVLQTPGRKLTCDPTQTLISA